MNLTVCILYQANYYKNFIMILKMIINIPIKWWKGINFGISISGEMTEQIFKFVWGKLDSICEGIKKRTDTQTLKPFAFD